MSSVRQDDGFLRMQNFAWGLTQVEGRSALPGHGAPHGSVGFLTVPAVPLVPGMPVLPWQRPGLLGFSLGGQPLFEMRCSPG